LVRSAVRRCGPYDGVRHLLKAVDCDDVIAETTSSRNGDTAKPEPGIVQVALDWASVDTVWDAHAAAGAGLPCIGLFSRGIAHAELQAAGGSPIFGDPQDLLDHPDSTRIAELAAGR
jgi:phosphoglycolate phosphatase-like HAD superfamily hydrolase